MPTYPGLYKAKAVKLSTTEVTALIPQVFGDTSVIITDFLGPPSIGMGWVFFQSGDESHPVWCSGLGGGGSVSDVVWVDPAAPTDKNIELWWDTDDTAPLDPRYLTPAQGDARYTQPADLSPPWISLTVGGGYVAEGSGFGAPAYRKVGDIVYIRGSVLLTGTFAAVVGWFTLPSGYRPPTNVRVMMGAHKTGVGGAYLVRGALNSTGAFDLAEYSATDKVNPTIYLSDIRPFSVTA